MKQPNLEIKVKNFSRPGYGLYDRAMGVMYILGIWDTLERR